MRNLFWGLLLVIIGVLLLLDNLGYADFGQIMANYWPLILVLWGISILARRGRRRASPPTVATSGSPGPPPLGEGELVHQSNVFGDIVTSITSKNFKGGSVSTVFGDCVIDLSTAVVAEGDHDFRVHGVFGDSTITLPSGIAASISASSVFGGLSILGERKDGISTSLEVTTPAYALAKNRLRLSVTKVFGSVRVS